MFFNWHIVGEARWRWLVGEVLVVIIGILAALSIEQAWSNRLNQDQELEYVRTIRSAVQADIDFVEGYLREQMNRKMDAIEAVGPVVRGFAPVPDNVELFLMNIGYCAISGVSPTYVVKRETYDDLVTSGNLRLVDDSRIRKEIMFYYANYDTRYDRTVARLTGYPEFVLGLVPSELRGEINLEAMESFNVDRAIEAIMSEEFETLLNREQNLAYFMQLQNKRFLEIARSFLSSLDTYIEQLE